MLLLVVAAAAQGADNGSAGEYLVFFGTYTAKTSKGIYAYRFQPSTGKLTAIWLFHSMVDRSSRVQKRWLPLGDARLPWFSQPSASSTCLERADCQKSSSF